MDNKPSGVILLVDDEVINLKIMTKYFSMENFDILTAMSSEQALELLEVKKPDIIVLDVMMPGIDGFELCEVLKSKEDLKDIPVLFTTALSDTKSKVKGFEVGGLDYITKPFHREELIARINTHLKLRKIRKELKESNNAKEQLLGELKKLNATKDKFFSIIAHDMRSSLVGLIGISKRLACSASDMDPDRTQKLAGLLFDSSKTSWKSIANELSDKIHNEFPFATGQIIENGKLSFIVKFKEKKIRMYWPVLVYKEINSENTWGSETEIAGHAYINELRLNSYKARMIRVFDLKNGYKTVTE